MEINEKILTGVAWLASLIAGGFIVSKIERKKNSEITVALLRVHKAKCDEYTNEINELKAQMEEDRHKAFYDGLEAGADFEKKFEEIFKKSEEAE